MYWKIIWIRIDDVNDDCVLDVLVGEVGVEVLKVGKVYKELFFRCVEYIVNFFYVYILIYL